MSEKQDYKQKIAEQAAEERKASKYNYNKVIFLLKEPYSNMVVKGPIRVNNRDAHRKLLDEAKEKQLYVWVAGVIKTKEDTYQAVEPHVIDWDSIPEKSYAHKHVVDHEPSTPRWPADLKCTKCGHQCNSTSGYTLHMKAHDRHDDVVEQTKDLQCPECGKKCSSTSGYTLHMKTHSRD